MPARSARRAPRAHHRHRTRRGLGHQQPGPGDRRYGTAAVRGAEPVRCPAAHQPRPGPRRHRQALAAEPAWVTAKGAITSHDVARAPPGHPSRGGRRPAVTRRHLGVRPGRRGTPSHRHGLHRLRRQRRRRPCPGPGRGHPQWRAAGPVTHQAPPPTNGQLATTPRRLREYDRQNVVGASSQAMPMPAIGNRAIISRRSAW